MVYRAHGDHKPNHKKTGLTESQIRDTIIDLEYLENGKIVTKRNSGHYFTDIHANDDIPKVKGHLVKFRSNPSGTGNHSKDYLHRGCGPVDPSIVPGVKWVALIIQGNCTFNEKLYYATTLSNASAAIIYWGQPDNDEMTMSASGTGNMSGEFILDVFLMELI